MQPESETCEEQGCTNAMTKLFKQSFTYSLLCDEHFEIAEAKRLRSIEEQARKAYQHATRNSLAAWQRSRI